MLALGSTNLGKKQAAESVQLGAPITLFGSFGDRFSFRYCLESFGGTLRQIQSFSL